MKNKKTMFRIYTLFEYEEEQAFLEEQHRKGWRCTGFKIPGFYSFEKCDPEEATYRIDFADTKCSDETSYRQLFADNGWEFLWAVNGFSIFRKMPGSNGGKEENEISHLCGQIEREVLSGCGGGVSKAALPFLQADADGAAGDPAA